MYQIPIIIYKDENGFYIGECPLIKGFHTFGKNIEELYSNMEEVRELFEDEIKEVQNNEKHNFFSLSFLPISSKNVNSSH